MSTTIGLVAVLLFVSWRFPRAGWTLAWLLVILSISGLLVLGLASWDRAIYSGPSPFLFPAGTALLALLMFALGVASNHRRANADFARAIVVR
jgi:hypothetical protein